MVDYRALLIKYINLVGGEEGVTFLNADAPHLAYRREGFTAEEWAALQECDKEG